jgi:hypothetical protein
MTEGQCSAGFKINGREKCPQCGAGPEGPCWTDYRMTMAENVRLKAEVELWKDRHDAAVEAAQQMEHHFDEMWQQERR